MPDVNPRCPNVQFFIIHRNGRKEILQRYCRSFAEARQLCINLRVIHRAQRVWF
jgi:hypothetical protein